MIGEVRREWKPDVGVTVYLAFMFGFKSSLRSRQGCIDELGRCLRFTRANISSMALGLVWVWARLKPSSHDATWTDGADEASTYLFVYLKYG